MGMIYKGFGRGKLLLFGEHAAVMGYPALGLGLEGGITVELEPDPEARHWILEDRDERENTIARDVMKRVDEAVAGLPKGGKLRSHSDLPEGRGFGSSAALCIALAEAALRAAGTPEVVGHRSLVWAIAHHAEGYFHGSPSGIDTGLAALGGLIAFKPSPPELPEWRRLPLRRLILLAGSLPRASSAKTLIAGIKERARDAASEEAGRLARLGALSEAAEGLFEGGEIDPREMSSKLGLLAREAQVELAGLGLVDPALAKLVAAGEAAGSAGGKMSGAGGGGAFWLVYAGLAMAKIGEAALRARAKELGLGEDLSLEILSLAD